MKKILIIIIFLFILFGICQTCQALIVEYPSIRNVTPSQGFPQAIRYIYLFALGAVGVVALLAMMIGAITYVTSAGNPSKAADAKDRILSALLGVLLLLASVLILRIINPNLVNEISPTLPPITGGGGNGNGGGIPAEARACFCGGVFERCYANGQTCRDQCRPYCQMMHDLWTIGICNINANQCP